MTIAQDFPSRSAAIIWIIDNQNARRNINEMTRAYLTGRRYEEEKKSHGGDRKSSDHSDPLKTSQKIASQLKVGEATVNAPLFLLKPLTRSAITPMFTNKKSYPV